jgi:diguanylate cyclase (GGDEF)-like protein/PAS domain S-box-containing protein
MDESSPRRIRGRVSPCFKEAPPGSTDSSPVANAKPGADPGWKPDPVTYQLAVEAAGVGAWDRVLATDAVRICPMMAQLLDLPPHATSLPADEWRTLIHAQDLPMVESAVAASINSDHPFSLEYRVKTHHGRIVWLLVRGTFIRDQHGKPVRVTGVSVDITDRKKAEEAAKASEQRYRALTDLNPDGILVYQEQRYVYANHAAASIYRVAEAAELIGRTAADMLEPEAAAAFHERMALLLEHDRDAPLATLRARRADGELAYIQATFGKVIWEGQPAVQITARDITEYKQLQDQLRITSERLKLAIEGVGEGIWDWNLVTDTYSLSDNLRRMFGWTDEDQATEKINWRQLIHPDDFRRVNTAISSCIQGERPMYECEFRLKGAEDRWKWVLGRGVVVEWDRDGAPAAMTGTISDITARKESEEQIWRHANIDLLTGLPNRRMFRDQLDKEIRKAHRSGKELALLFLDMDGFKQVNDLFGHEAGDQLLAMAASRLKACVRESDIVARLGGDEFTVVLGDLDHKGHLEFVCEKILTVLAQPFNIGANSAHVTASIGIAMYPVDGLEGNELGRKADNAMYAAKAAGKNQFCYFTRTMDEIAHTRLRMSNALHHALRLDQLSIHYQPIVNLRNGRVAKAEALLRWKHPSLGDILPSAFVPLAEENGVIGQIGTWIFQEAALKSRQWSKLAGEKFQISINKSPVQFMARDTETDWLDYLAKLNIPCDSLVIEITEGMLLHASSSVMDRLLELRGAGIQIAIDDFGTGYSSMAYLRKFEIDYLKIDRSFVQDIETDLGSRTIVETIVVMAHKLGMKVIAEGIESLAQARLLANAGCDFGQGFFFSPPVHPDRMEPMLSREFPG